MSSDNGNSSAASDRRGQVALKCYFGALAAIAECLTGVCAPVGAPYRSRILRTTRRLAFGADPDAMEQSGEALESDLQQFAEDLGSYQKESQDGAARILRNLSASILTMADRHAAELAMLRDAVEQMQASAEVDDSVQIRRMVRQQATGLRSVAERLERDHRELRQSLAVEARDLRSWLEPKEPALAIDAATGCLTRATVERHLRRNRGIRHPFCLLLIRCSGLAQKPSELIGEAMARVAERLAEQVRPRDVIARWSADSFLVVFEADGRRAEARSGQIARWLSDRYALAAEGGGTVADVQVRIRVIEPRGDEPIEALAERIDTPETESEPAVAALS